MKNKLIKEVTDFIYIRFPILKGWSYVYVPWILQVQGTDESTILVLFSTCLVRLELCGCIQLNGQCFPKVTLKAYWQDFLFWLDTNSFIFSAIFHKKFRGVSDEPIPIPWTSTIHIFEGIQKTESD